MKRGIIISFVQTKGGVGKSTLAANLSVFFSYTSKVKIIDCDIRQRTCSKWIARRNELHSDKPKVSCAIQVDDLYNAIIEDSKHYDVLIIDVQGRDSKNLRTVLLVSDIVYIPFLPSQNDIETIEELSEILEETQKQNEARKTFYILNHCPTHYLDQTKNDAHHFLQEYSTILIRSQAQITYRKAYKVASLEGLGVIESQDIKSKKEIQVLAKEIEENV